MIGGFDTNDISRFDDVTFNYGGSNYLNRLSLDVDVDCDIGLALCDDSLNFLSDPLAIATAYAILYKTGEILANWIGNSINMSYTKLVNRENLAREMLVWAAKIQR